MMNNMMIWLSELFGLNVKKWFVMTDERKRKIELELTRVLHRPNEYIFVFPMRICNKNTNEFVSTYEETDVSSYMSMVEIQCNERVMVPYSEFVECVNRVMGGYRRYTVHYRHGVSVKIYVSPDVEKGVVIS